MLWRSAQHPWSYEHARDEYKMDAFFSLQPSAATEASSYLLNAMKSVEDYVRFLLQTSLIYLLLSRQVYNKKIYNYNKKPLFDLIPVLLRGFVSKSYERRQAVEVLSAVVLPLS